MLNLNCVICAELFSQTDDVHVTTCGHIFHFVCLTQWLERSKTCPQCRAKCGQRNIFRLYFNLANLDTSSIDVGSLQEQLDNLKLQLKLKEQAIQKADTEIKNLKESQKKSMKTICGLETKLQKKDVIINCYTEQVNILKADARHTDDLRKEVKNLRYQLETAEGVASILSASNTEAEQLLKTENDPKKLCVLVAALKRELVNCRNQKTELRNDLRAVQNDLRREIEKKMNLEERIVALESECYQLNEKLKSLERPVASTSKTALNRHSDIGLKSNHLEVLRMKERPSISPTIKENVRQIEESASPYLNIKSSCVGFMPYAFKRKVDSTTTSTKPIAGMTKLATLKISPSKTTSKTSTLGELRKTSSDINEKYSLFKKPRLTLATSANRLPYTSNSNLVFNGFGGSEKIDPFASKVELLYDDVEDSKSLPESKSSKTLKKTNPALSERVKSGGLRNFMVQKPQKK